MGYQNFTIFVYVTSVNGQNQYPNIQYPEEEDVVQNLTLTVHKLKREVEMLKKNAYKNSKTDNKTLLQDNSRVGTTCV